MNKDNILWKLDLLEVKHLKAKPRLTRTTTLLKARNKRLPLLDLNRDDALAKIEELKSQLCERKIHSSVLKLNRMFKKVIKQDQNKIASKLKSKPDDEKLKQELSLLNDLDSDLISHSRLIKIVSAIYKVNAKFVDTVPLFLPEWCKEAITNTEDKHNPKFQFKSNSQQLNNIISKISNNKDFKALIESIESSLMIVLGPVEKKRNIKDIESDNEEFSSEDEDVEDESEEEEEIIPENEDEILDAYKGMLVASDEEDDEEVGFELDPNVNYNEVTDEEPSESEDSEEDEEDQYEKLKVEKRKLENDDFFDALDEKKAKKEKKEKANLPALQAGYFSGGESDSDVDNDKVVKAATTQRKNRRGQRARQKIWELKYGSNAKHVEKEKDRVRSEREQRQREYEERVRKREEKQKLLIEQGGTGSNQTPLSRQRTHKPSAQQPVTATPEAEKPLHPSWEAKLRAQELSKQKFTGKKVKFD